MSEAQPNIAPLPGWHSDMMRAVRTQARTVAITPDQFSELQRDLLDMLTPAVRDTIMAWSPPGPDIIAEKGAGFVATIWGVDVFLAEAVSGAEK